MDLVINSHPLYRWAMPEFKCRLGLFNVETPRNERESVRNRAKCKKKKVVFEIIFNLTLAFY